ncbi:MAG: sodium:proton exchanger [Flavobacteriales bacterium]|nr:MAG: sodium:proton exchanger [Flavobacteriales bacterium]
MNIPLIIILIGLLIFGAHLFNGLFKFTKIPNVLILLIIGIVTGPLLGFVNEGHFGKIGPIFTSITLVLILFESGTNLKIRELFKSIGSAFLLTLFNFFASAIIGTAVAVTFFSDIDFLSATFFGVIIAGTSSAVVIPIIKQLKMNKKGYTTLMLESALSDVLCLVIGLALLQAMKQGVFELSSILNAIWQSFLFAFLIGFAGGFVWSIIIKFTRILENSKVMNLAMVFIIYGLTEYLGLNGGIAVLIFGITLGNAHLLQNTPLKTIFPSKELLENEKDFFSELVFIMSTFFFVYVGICMKFGSIGIYALALLIVVAIILIRPISIKLLVKTKMSFKDLGIMSIMAPKGLVPAILASIPIQYGLAGGENIQMLSFAVVLLSIIICSILVIILSKNPLKIGYLKNVLGHEEEEENNLEEETSENDSPVKIINKTENSSESNTSSNE